MFIQLGQTNPDYTALIYDFDRCMTKDSTLIHLTLLPVQIILLTLAKLHENWPKCYLQSHRVIDEAISNSLRKYSVNRRESFTCAVSKYRDFGLIAAKSFDILIHPFQCQQLIFQAHIAGIVGCIQSKKSEWSQAIVERNLM